VSDTKGKVSYPFPPKNDAYDNKDKPQNNIDNISKMNDSNDVS